VFCGINYICWLVQLVSKYVFFLSGFMELILGAFATFKKAAVNFVMSVHMQQLGSHPTDFYEI